jgi:hypothetical protein
MSKKIPVSVTDLLMHQKDTDMTERVVLPITRYKNVLNAPQLVNNPYSVKGAPFLLYATETETLDTSEIRKYINGLI